MAIQMFTAKFKCIYVLSRKFETKNLGREEVGSLELKLCVGFEQQRKN